MNSMELASDASEQLCRLEGCDNAPSKRSAFCSFAHRTEYRRIYKREHMRREREAQAELDAILTTTDGRSIPGQGADAHTPKTQHHPSRRFAQKPEQDVIDYVTGSVARHSAFSAPQRRTDLQRWRAPHVEDDSWQPEDTDYYDGVEFRPMNDMTVGPYRGGYARAGTPVAFQVVRAGR